jgi:hypothetical protein
MIFDFWFMVVGLGFPARRIPSRPPAPPHPPGECPKLSIVVGLARGPRVEG